jgi:hypothetical protein
MLNQLICYPEPKKKGFPFLRNSKMESLVWLNFFLTSAGDFD